MIRAFTSALLGLLILECNYAEHPPAPLPAAAVSPSGIHVVRSVPTRLTEGGRWTKTRVYFYSFDDAESAFVQRAHFEIEQFAIELFVSDDGAFIVAMDSYPGHGTSDVVAVYDASGKKLKAWDAQHFIGTDAIRKQKDVWGWDFVRWRGRASWIGDGRKIWVEPFPGIDGAGEVIIDLETLTLSSSARPQPVPGKENEN